MLSISLLVKPLAGRRLGAGLGLLGLLLMGALMLVPSILAAAEAALEDEALLEAARRLHREQPALFNGATGVLVTGVEAGSQAESTGIRRGDILLRYGGEPLDTVEGLIAQTQRIPAEDEVGIALRLVLRGGRMGAQVRSVRKTGLALMIELNQAGRTARLRADYPAALAAWREGLAIAREAGHQQGIAIFLGNIGIVYQRLSDYPRALDYFEQALAIRREIGDRRSEGADLGNIGVVYDNLGDYSRALDHYRQALAIKREIGDRRGEGGNLGNIGIVYQNLGDYPQALDYYRQALAIHREIGARRSEGDNLGNIGNVYQNLGDYPRALDHHQQALAIDREIGARHSEGDVLGNIGVVYDDLGDYPRALEHHRQALAIHREIGDRRGEGTDLSNIGNVYSNQGDYPRALDHFQQALAIKREIGDRRGEGSNLTNMGIVYKDLGDYPRALDHYRQALAIDREINDRRGEGVDLHNIGLLLLDQRDLPQAQTRLQQALTIQAETAAPDSLWHVWNGLRRVLAAQARPQAAILAGKQAVNTLQAMRGTNQALDQALQHSFLSEKTFVYQGLADLLIERGRPAEAQQVLDMLKESEFYDYIQQDDGHDPRSIRAGFNRVEADWKLAFEQTAEQLIGTAKSLGDLTRIHVDIRSPEQRAEIDQLTKRSDALSAQLQQHQDDLISDFEATPPDRQAELNADMNQPPANKPGLLAALSKLSGTRTGLLQFILLPDKVRILLTTPDGWQTAVAEVASDQLNGEIEALREALTNPRSDPKPPAQALYQRLVAPLADAIDAAKFQSLLVQLDGRLRYIPFAALHDGEQWLAERWPLVYYTAASERQAALAGSDWRVAGFGTSKKHGKFPALPAVRGEVNGIVRESGEGADEGVLPGIVRLDQAFTRDALWHSADGDYNILHIASHFDLQPGNDSQSSLLIGNGELLSLRQLRESDPKHPKLDLRHVDLVTLSACNTAMGGADATGAEIEGMGAIVQRQGAHGVLASLWPVADASTGKLMQTLYRLRGGQPELTKAQALRRASLACCTAPIPSSAVTERGAWRSTPTPASSTGIPGAAGATLITGRRLS